MGQSVQLYRKKQNLHNARLTKAFINYEIFQKAMDEIGFLGVKEEREVENTEGFIKIEQLKIRDLRAMMSKEIKELAHLEFDLLQINKQLRHVHELMEYRRRLLEKLKLNHKIYLPSGALNANNEFLHAIKDVDHNIRIIISHISIETDKWLITRVHKLYAKEEEDRGRIEEISKEAEIIKGDIMKINRELYDSQALLSEVESGVKKPERRRMGF